MANERSGVRPSFLQPLISGLPDRAEPPRLDPVEQRRLSQQLREIAASRDEAAVHGRDYLIS